MAHVDSCPRVLSSHDGPVQWTRSTAVTLIVAAFYIAPACGGLTKGEAGDGGPEDDSPSSSSSSGSSSGVMPSSSSSGSSGSSSGGLSSSSSGSGSSSGSFTDAGCSILPIFDPTDAGPVENFPCEACISSNCQAQECPCTADTNITFEDGGTLPACDAYVECVYDTFVQTLESSDAGVMDATLLEDAQSACAGSVPTASIAMGNSLIGCVASNCATQCVP